MASLRRSRANAARARADQAAPVLERMEEASSEPELESTIVERSSREPWAKPWLLAPLCLLLTAVMVMNTLGWWPFQVAHEEFAAAEVQRGREQLLQIEALRVLSVHAATGRLPESLAEIEPGLDRLLHYEVLDGGRFLLNVAGGEAATEMEGIIYDATTGRPEPAEDQP